MIADDLNRAVKCSCCPTCYDDPRRNDPIDLDVDPRSCEVCEEAPSEVVVSVPTRAGPTDRSRGRRVRVVSPPRYRFCWHCSRQLYSYGYRVVEIDGHSVRVHASCFEETLSEARSRAVTARPKPRARRT